MSNSGAPPSLANRLVDLPLSDPIRTTVNSAPCSPACASNFFRQCNSNIQKSRFNCHNHRLGHATSGTTWPICGEMGCRCALSECIIVIYGRFYTHSRLGWIAVTHKQPHHRPHSSAASHARLTGGGTLVTARNLKIRHIVYTSEL